MGDHVAENILITILGPTASGKTKVAAELANRVKGEVISADSRQVYRSMDIGTGKDYGDYMVNNQKIPFHLIDIKEPGYKYNVFEYQGDFIKVYHEIVSRNKTPILCGGTGLYIEAATLGYHLIEVPPDIALRERLEKYSLNELTDMLKKYRPLHNATDTDTKKRAIRAIEIEMKQTETRAGDYKPPFHPVFIGIKYDRLTERERITARLKQRLENGMAEEVQALLNRGISADNLCYYGLEYKFVTLYLTGKMGYEEMFGKLNTAIHQFAKRQMTWFRRMERKGMKVHWIDGHLPLNEKLKLIEDILETV